MSIQAYRNFEILGHCFKCLHIKFSLQVLSSPKCNCAWSSVWQMNFKLSAWDVCILGKHTYFSWAALKIVQIGNQDSPNWKWHIFSILQYPVWEVSISTKSILGAGAGLILKFHSTCLLLDHLWCGIASQILWVW